MTKKQQHQSSQLLFLAIAAVFSVVAVLILSRNNELPETRVQGAESISAQELLYQLNETVDDAGQSELREINEEIIR